MGDGIGTDKLCRAVYGREARAKDWLGGGDANMLNDAAKMIARLRKENSTLSSRLTETYKHIRSHHKRQASNAKAIVAREKEMARLRRENTNLRKNWNHSQMVWAQECQLLRTAFAQAEDLLRTGQSSAVYLRESWDQVKTTLLSRYGRDAKLEEEKTEERFEVLNDPAIATCIYCGNTSKIQLWPHRDKNNQVVGFVFACLGCADSVCGVSMDIKYPSDKLKSKVDGVWKCSECGAVETMEREVKCWKCGKGEMIFTEKEATVDDPGKGAYKSPDETVDMKNPPDLLCVCGHPYSIHTVSGCVRGWGGSKEIELCHCEKFTPAPPAPEPDGKDAEMLDTKRGIYDKFTVIRNDGRSASGEKHHKCQYFVIDLVHDAYAGAALRAYADACEDSYPELAEDLRKMFPGSKSEIEWKSDDVQRLVRAYESVLDQVRERHKLDKEKLVTIDKYHDDALAEIARLKGELANAINTNTFIDEARESVVDQLRSDRTRYKSERDAAIREVGATARKLGEVENQLEQAQVQLAGCGTAANGATNTNVAKRGGYGWSQAYEDTLKLRREYDHALAKIERVREKAELCENDNAHSLWVRGYNSATEAIRAELDREA